MSSDSPPVVVLALSAGEALSLAADAQHPLARWIGRADAVAIGLPGEFADPDRRGAEPTTLVAHLSRRFPDALWFATASLARDFPYNIARRVGSLSATTLSRTGLALVPGPTRLPVERPAGAAELVADGILAIRGLWESWPRDSIVADRASRVFVDSGRITRVDHDAVFRVRGPLQVPVDAADLPPIAVWADGTPPGAELAFTSDGSVVTAAGRAIGSVISGDADDVVVALQELDAAGRLRSRPRPDGLRAALGLPPGERTLTGPARAFTETAVLL